MAYASSFCKICKVHEFESSYQTGRNTNSIHIPDGNYILEEQLIVIYFSSNL